MSKSGPPAGARTRSARLLAAAAAAVWLATAACSATATRPSSSTAAPTTPSSTRVGAPAGIAGYITILGRRVAIPDEGKRPIDPIEDVGQQVIITQKAIEPHRLFCDLRTRLTFTNLTPVPQLLTFVNDGGWHSPKIPPGGRWSYTPAYGISYYYTTATGLQATFQASAPIAGNP